MGAGICSGEGHQEIRRWRGKPTQLHWSAPHNTSLHCTSTPWQRLSTSNEHLDMIGHVMTWSNMTKYVTSNHKMANHNISCQVNHASRTEVSTGYLTQMFRAKIIVTSNPSYWEGGMCVKMMRFKLNFLSLYSAFGSCSMELRFLCQHCWGTECGSTHANNMRLPPISMSSCPCFYHIFFFSQRPTHHLI